MLRGAGHSTAVAGPQHGVGPRGLPVAATWHTKSLQHGSPCCSRMFLAPGWLTLPAACGQPCVPGSTHGCSQSCTSPSSWSPQRQLVGAPWGGLQSLSTTVGTREPALRCGSFAPSPPCAPTSGGRLCVCCRECGPALAQEGWLPLRCSLGGDFKPSFAVVLLWVCTSAAIPRWREVCLGPDAEPGSDLSVWLRVRGRRWGCRGNLPADGCSKPWCSRSCWDLSLT